MPDRVLPGPVRNSAEFKEAVCICTNKIFDSCRDKDCIDELRFFPTRDSQEYIDNAVSVRAKSAKLLHVNIDVDEVSFNRGFFTVDIRYFYKIKGEAFSFANRPHEITGLAVFDKRSILFGSEYNAKIFTSKKCHEEHGRDEHHEPCCQNMPTAVVEAVDPIVLNMKLVDRCESCCETCITEIPRFMEDEFTCELLFDNPGKRVLVTLGQFSIVRLERDTQLLIPTYEYSMPEKEHCGSEEDPCALFSKIHFPMDEFFSPDTLDVPEGYREARENYGK